MDTEPKKESPPEQYRLVCMAFDGEFQAERPEFGTLEEVAGYDNDLGSKWYFYPFHFAVKGDVVAGSFSPLKKLEGKRIEMVKRLFNHVSKLDEAKNAGVDEFVSLVAAEFERFKEWSDSLNPGEPGQDAPGPGR